MSVNSRHSLGVVGATGAVGRKFLAVLAERGIAPRDLRLFASERSKGLKLPFGGCDIEVEAVDGAAFKGLDVVFFSAGADVSKEVCPKAMAAGAVVIDNSNAWRMEEGVPLVVPEVNAHALRRHRGLIANPNCSTIQMVVAVAPIHRVNPVRRIVVSTYQSVSGTGAEAVEILERQSAARLAGQPLPTGVYAHPIGFNLFPHIDTFLDSGSCREEEKMVRETQKIMEAPIPVSATVVRVPVFFCHSEAVNLELTEPVDLPALRRALAAGPGVVLMDDPARNVYPTPLQCQDRDDVFVGRVRVDPSIAHGLNLWVVADNLRKGAATNGVQIYEALVKEGLL